MSLLTELNKNFFMKSVDIERGAYDPPKYNVPVFDGDTKKTQNLEGCLTVHLPHEII